VFSGKAFLDLMGPDISSMRMFWEAILSLRAIQVLLDSSMCLFGFYLKLSPDCSDVCYCLMLFASLAEKSEALSVIDH